MLGFARCQLLAAVGVILVMIAPLLIAAPVPTYNLHDDSVGMARRTDGSVSSPIHETGAGSDLHRLLATRAPPPPTSAMSAPPNNAVLLEAVRRGTFLVDAIHGNAVEAKSQIEEYFRGQRIPENIGVQMNERPEDMSKWYTITEYTAVAGQRITTRLTPLYQALIVTEPIAGRGSTTPNEMSPKRLVSTDYWSKGPNRGFSSVQDIDYPSRGGNIRHGKCKATGASSNVMVNIRDGVLVKGPATSAMEILFAKDSIDVPSIFLESSLWWAHWLHEHGKFQDSIHYAKMPPAVSMNVIRTRKRHLNWVIMPAEEHTQDVSKKTKATVDIANQCLASTGIYKPEQMPSIGMPESYFPAGSWCFNALLSTGSNLPVALFVALHKAPETFGHRTIVGVAITTLDQVETSNGQSLRPTLVWEISDFKPENKLCAQHWAEYSPGDKLPLTYDPQAVRHPSLQTQTPATASQPLRHQGEDARASQSQGSGHASEGQKSHSAKAAPPAECYTPLMMSWTDPAYIQHSSIRPLHYAAELQELELVAQKTREMGSMASSNWSKGGFAAPRGIHSPAQPSSRARGKRPAVNQSTNLFQKAQSQASQGPTGLEMSEAAAASAMGATGGRDNEGLNLLAQAAGAANRPAAAAAAAAMGLTSGSGAATAPGQRQPGGGPSGDNRLAALADAAATQPQAPTAQGQGQAGGNDRLAALADAAATQPQASNAQGQGRAGGNDLLAALADAAATQPQAPPTQGQGRAGGNDRLAALADAAAGQPQAPAGSSGQPQAGQGQAGQRPPTTRRRPGDPGYDELYDDSD